MAPKVKHYKNHSHKLSKMWFHATLGQKGIGSGVQVQSEKRNIYSIKGGQIWPKKGQIQPKKGQIWQKHMQSRKTYQDSRSHYLTHMYHVRSHRSYYICRSCLIDTLLSIIGLSLAQKNIRFILLVGLVFHLPLLINHAHI